MVKTKVTRTPPVLILDVVLDATRRTQKKACRWDMVARRNVIDETHHWPPGLWASPIWWYCRFRSHSIASRSWRAQRSILPKRAARSQPREKKGAIRQNSSAAYCTVAYLVQPLCKGSADLQQGLDGKPYWNVCARPLKEHTPNTAAARTYQ